MIDRAGSATGPRRICFLHIPKTGGTSLIEALKARFDPGDVISDNNFLSRQLIASSGMGDRRNVLFLGHPVDNILEALGDDCDVFTFLRKPRDQTVSIYLHITWDREHPEHDAAMRMGFQRFIRSNWNYVASQTVTLAVAMSGRRDLMLPEIERRAWEVRSLLDRMFFVGTLERAEESCSLLSEMLGLAAPLSASNLNTAQARGAFAEVIKDLRAQYDALRDDPATSYLLAIEQETYRKAASVLDARLRKRPSRAARPQAESSKSGW